MAKVKYCNFLSPFKQKVNQFLIESAGHSSSINKMDSNDCKEKKLDFIVVKKLLERDNCRHSMVPFQLLQNSISPNDNPTLYFQSLDSTKRREAVRKRFVPVSFRSCAVVRKRQIDLTTKVEGCHHGGRR